MEQAAEYTVVKNHKATNRDSKSGARPGKRNSVRVIGGALRSRRIEFVDHDGLRPTSDRIRETLFNWLQNPVIGAHCLDLFAGSGVLGIEALSRGASSVDFVEADRKVATRLAESLKTLELSNAHLATMRAEQWLEQNAGSAQRAYDLVFLDPPFSENFLPAICSQLNQDRLLAPNALLYLETDKPLQAEWIPENWQQLKAQKAGQVFYYLYQSGEHD